MDNNLKPFVFLLVTVFFLSLSGCHLFETTKVSESEIKRASSWSDKDQYPRFLSCEGLEGEDEKDCFESVISSKILNYIEEQDWIASENIDTEVVLNLVINEEGFISMASLDASSKIEAAIPNLESTLADAVNQIPQAQAAIKSNVGTLVSTSFKLPIRISALEDN